MSTDEPNGRINRRHYNVVILSILMKYLEYYPDSRFCQVLTNLGLDGDRYYEEPDVTLVRVVENCKDLLDG